MTKIRFVALPTPVARAYQSGAADAYGMPPEKKIANSVGLPCRHCLEDVEKGEGYLVLAHRPFSFAQPYAEIGPIVLHARECSRHPETDATPEVFLKRQQMAVRGYDKDERIVYGTAQIVPTSKIAEVATEILGRPEVASVHLRSGTTTCFQCLVERDQ